MGRWLSDELQPAQVDDTNYLGHFYNGGLSISLFLLYDYGACCAARAHACPPPKRVPCGASSDVASARLDLASDLVFCLVLATSVSCLVFCLVLALRRVPYACASVTSVANEKETGIGTAVGGVVC